jgi:hypothetical protein
MTKRKSSLHAAFQAAVNAHAPGLSFSFLAPRSFWEHIFTSLGGGAAHYHTLHVGKGRYGGDINDGGILTKDDE